MPDRDVLSLLTLQPGVTQAGYVAGARSDQSNITLDGVDINDAQSNAIDGPVLRLNAEAIRSFASKQSIPMRTRAGLPAPRSTW